MFAVKFFFSCQVIDDGCNCSQDLRAFDSLTTTVYEALPDSIFVEVNEEQPIEKTGFLIANFLESSPVTTSKRFFKNANLGFANAYACDCVPEYINSMRDIRIYLINQENEEKIDVSTQFDIESDYSSKTSINQFFEEENSLDEIETFELSFNENEDIPNTAIFEIEVELEDGTIFTNQTGVINFLD